MRKKYTIEQVKNYFKERGCDLLEETYINCDTSMKYKCNCGNVSKITFYKFKQGQRCKKCGRNEKYTFGYVYNCFNEQSCELLEKEYRSNIEPMKYRCNCNRISKITFNEFRKGKRCKKCGNEKIANQKRRPFSYICDFFKKNNCELLETTYQDSRTAMKYRCSCGNISKINFSSFQNGNRCMKCGAKKRSGINNCNYNPYITDEEREERKSRTSDLHYQRWRKKVFRRDDYICQKCLIRGGNLNAHHIASWANNKKLRLKKSNGITFCENCHNEFHKKYTKNNNNQQQLDEFLGKIIVVS